MNHWLKSCAAPVLPVVVICILITWIVPCLTSFSPPTKLISESIKKAFEAEIQAAVPDFSVQRIELYFENRRPDITVQREYPLKAFVDLKYTGSGLLQGYWEVDGRTLSYVNQHVMSGQVITLDSPSIPPLPTFNPGSHILRFVITNPSEAVPMPSALYFVMSSEFKGRNLAIKLTAPKDKAVLDYAPVKFAWEPFDKNTTYSIQFFKQGESKTLFALCVLEPSYTLPLDVIKNVFIPGEQYLWKIKGCSTENNVGESETRAFTFKR